MGMNMMIKDNRTKMKGRRIIEAILIVTIVLLMSTLAMATDPNAPTGLGQYQNDGTTAITQGGNTDETVVNIRATVTDPDNDNVQLQVEVIDNASAFTGTPNCVSPYVTSGSTANAFCPGLSIGTSYKWQARTSDGNTTSAWQTYGASDPDFTVTSPPTLHNSDNLGNATYGTWGVTGGRYGQFVCTTCHITYSETTTNIRRIRENITAPNGTDTWPNGSITTNTIVFTQADGTNSDMGDTASPFNGICNVCHDNANHTYYSYNNSDGTHNVGADCTACHQHRYGFAGRDCNGCHGGSGTTGAPLVSGDLVGVQDPYYPATGHTEGAHNTHVETNGFTDCNICHNNNGMPTVDELITIAFSGDATANGSSPIYDGIALNTPYSYTGDVTGPSTATQDCSNVYCHSNVQGQTDGTGSPTSYGTPDWANASSVQCGSCHKADGTQGNATLMDSGTHTTHVDSGTYNRPCSTCHSGAGAGSSVHVNNTINVNIDATYGGSYNGSSTTPGDHSPGQGYGSCSNVYCHSDARTPTYTSPSWGGATLNCTGCHGGAGGSTGGAGTTLTTSHTVHTNTSGFAYTCNYCHTTTASNNTTIADYSRHANKTKNIAVDTSVGGTGTDGGNYSSNKCSNIYCHGSTSPDWTTGGTTGDCSLCHGMAASASDGRDTNGDTANTDPQVGAHVAHLNNTHGYRSTGISCSECHTEPTGATYVDKVKATGHIDSSLPAEVPLNGTLATNNGATPSYSGAPGGTCSNTYCHDGRNFKNGWSTAAQIEFETPDWNTPIMDGTVNDCDNCHGYPPGGSHTTNTNCSQCHTHVNTSNDGFTDPSLHIDGQVIAQQGGSCNSCHGYPPVQGDGFACQDDPICEGKGAHQQHVNNIASAKGVTLDPNNDQFGTGTAATVCGTCHTNNSANHMSGTRVINFGDGSTEYEFVNGGGVTYNGVPGTSSSTNLKSCSNISCHFGESPGWQDPATAGP